MQVVVEKETLEKIFEEMVRKLELESRRLQQQRAQRLKATEASLLYSTVGGPNRFQTFITNRYKNIAIEQEESRGEEVFRRFTTELARRIVRLAKNLGEDLRYTADELYRFSEDGRIVKIWIDKDYGKFRVVEYVFIYSPELDIQRRNELLKKAKSMTFCIPQLVSSVNYVFIYKKRRGVRHSVKGRIYYYYVALHRLRSLVPRKMAYVLEKINNGIKSKIHKAKKALYGTVKELYDCLVNFWDSLKDLYVPVTKEKIPPAKSPKKEKFVRSKSRQMEAKGVKAGIG